MNKLSTLMKVLDAFIQSIIRLNPGDKNLKVGYEYFSWGRSANPKMIWELFMANISPYRQAILERDESVFIHKKINKDKLAQNVSTKVGGEGAFQSILNIKHIWQNQMTEAQKVKIWKALGIMVKLSDDIFMDDVVNNNRIVDVDI